jgi:hypothetical protein
MSEFNDGLDFELGVTEEEKVVPIKAEKERRKPFHIWKVHGQEYKLKLNTQMIGALERKYKTNILNLISGDGLPPLSVMLTIIQAAATPWNHGMDYEKVRKLYEFWFDEGGSQVELLSKVIMPIFVVSGFFTEKQGIQIMEELENSEDLL